MMSAIYILAILLYLSFIVKIQSNAINPPVLHNIICCECLHNLEAILGSILIVPLNCPIGKQFINGNCHVTY